jgi:hypothetical protein
MEHGMPRKPLASITQLFCSSDMDHQRSTHPPVPPSKVHRIRKLMSLRVHTIRYHATRAVSSFSLSPVQLHPQSCSTTTSSFGWRFQACFTPHHHIGILEPTLTRRPPAFACFLTPPFSVAGNPLRPGASNQCSCRSSACHQTLVRTSLRMGPIGYDLDISRDLVN